MRTTSLLIFSITFLFACQEQSVSEQMNHVTEVLPEIAISTPDQIYIDRESGEPANGEFVSLHEDGSLRAALTFSGGMIIDGKISEAPDGLYRSYSDTEQIEWIFIKKNGVHVSTLLIDGVKVQQAGHGERLTDVKLMRRWSIDGTPISEFSEYRMREWHPNGELKSIAEFDPDGSGLNGRVAAWLPNGQIAGESFYHNNLLHGSYREWDEEGNLITEKYYKEGEPVTAERD
jgi:antitoxin component YwqK of YwqJK toxin-antitoxin module